MITVQAGGLLLARRSEALCQAGGFEKSLELDYKIKQ